MDRDHNPYEFARRFGTNVPAVYDGLLAARGFTRPSGMSRPDSVAGSPVSATIAATFAHRDTPDLARLATALLRAQDGSPHVLIVDTGSTAANLDALRRIEGDGVSIATLPRRSWSNSSEVVALACDVALDWCATEEYLFYTHSDCFLRRRDLLADWRRECGKERPVIGYQLTDRSRAEIARLGGGNAADVPISRYTEEWVWMTGHTALMVHLPTIRRLGLRWGFAAGRAAGVMPRTEGYEDTETYFNWWLRRRGITPILKGSERNYARNVNDDFDHVRSVASSFVFRGGVQGTAEWRANREAWMRDAMTEAESRIARWAKPRVAKGAPHCVPCVNGAKE